MKHVFQDWKILHKGSKSALHKLQTTRAANPNLAVLQLTHGPRFAHKYLDTGILLTLLLLGLRASRAAARASPTLPSARLALGNVAGLYR